MALCTVRREGSNLRYLWQRFLMITVFLCESSQDGDPVVMLTPLSSMCRFSHDSIVTCSRDGTAIIWMLQSLKPNVTTNKLLNFTCFDVFNAAQLMLFSFVISEENVTLECCKMWMKSMSVY